jgi:hypothetical protein
MRVFTLVQEVMVSHGEENADALADLKADVDVLLEGISQGLEVTSEVFAHTLGIACRQIAMRVDDQQYAKSAIWLLSRAVDLSFEALPTQGDLDEFLFFLTTYLRCVASLEVTDPTLHRVEPMLRFASRAARFRTSPNGYTCWAYLAHLLTLEARVGVFRSHRDSLLRARAALVRANSYRPPPKPDEETALLIASGDVFATLIDVGLERDPAMADAKLELVLERREALDHTFGELGRPPHSWRAILLSRVTSACPDPARVLGTWAARWLVMDGWLAQTQAWMESGVSNAIPDLLSRDPQWVGCAWLLVIQYLDPLLKRTIMDLPTDFPKSIPTRKDGYSLEELAGLTKHLLAVQAGVARSTGIDAECVHMAAILIGRTAMSRETLEQLAEDPLDEHERATVGDLVRLSPEGSSAQAAQDAHRKRIEGLFRQSAALRVGSSPGHETLVLLRNIVAEVVQEPLGEHVTRLIHEAVSTTGSLQPGVTQMQGTTELAWAALAAPAAWSASLLDELRGLIARTGNSLQHVGHVTSVYDRCIIYDLVQCSEAVNMGVIPEERLLEALRWCLSDAATDPALLETVNGLIDLVTVRVGGEGLCSAVEFGAALAAWEAAQLDGAMALRREAALLLARAWVITGMDTVTADEAKHVREALLFLADDVRSGLTPDVRCIYLLARHAASASLQKMLGLSEADYDLLKLNVADHALANVKQVGWEAVAGLLITLCSSKQDLTINTRRIADLVRQVGPRLVEDNLYDLWLDLIVTFCLEFRNIDNTAVSTAAERADLLTECLKSELLVRRDTESRVLAMFAICETLSILGHWDVALRTYRWLDEAVRPESTISPMLVAVVDANHARTVCVAAALAGDAKRAANELSQIRAELSLPLRLLDGLDVLVSELTTAAIVLQETPSESAVMTAHAILEDCFALPPQELAMLPGSAYVSFVRVASELTARDAVDVTDVERVVDSCAARAQEEASAGNPRLAAVLRETDLRLAAMRRDTPALLDRFRAIVAHQDVSRLGARSYFDLVATSSMAGALMGAIDILVDEGYIRDAAELLDELPCRTVRLAVAADLAPSFGQSDAGDYLAAEVIHAMTNDGTTDPNVSAKHKTEWYDLGETDEAILWEEATWASMLDGRPIDEGRPRAVIRAWAHGGEHLRLLVTTPDGEVTHIATAREVAGLSPPDKWDPGLIQSWAQAPSFSVDDSHGTGTEAAPLSAHLCRVLGRGDIHSKVVSVIDFTGAAYVVPMLREVLLTTATQGAPPDVTAIPSTRRAGKRNGGSVRKRYAVHLGDWSGTLVGPWLEAAYALSLTGIEVECRFPGSELAFAGGDAPELLVVSAHGALARERPDRLGEVRFGSSSLGMEEVASAIFPAPCVALLGACEVGRAHTQADELHGASLPSMLLHRGTEAVIAPVSSVDDLSSAVLVTRALYYFTAGAAASAVSAALAEVAKWSALDVQRWTIALMEGFANSRLADQAPWPRDIICAYCNSWLARVECDGIASRLRPYVVTTW